MRLSMKFKVGDLVRVCDSNDIYEGIIVAVDKDDPLLPYRVFIDDQLDGFAEWFEEIDLTLKSPE